MHHTGCALLVVLAVVACGNDVPGGACNFADADVVDSEGWKHVTSEDDIHYEHNPPASGPHFPVWATWGLHEDVVKRGHWVHNLEHGGIVLLVGPNATDEQEQHMRDAFDAIPDDEECGHKRAVWTKDPLLDSHVAVVAADHVMEGDDLDVDVVVDFATACRNRARENICQ